MPTVVIKLGSSVVADADGALRAGVLGAVADQVAALASTGVDPVIVSSGAIAHGLALLGIPPGRRPRGLGQLQAASAVGQGKLYRVYDELLAARGVQSAQVLLTFLDISGGRASYLNARETLARLLEWHVVPVINENDSTATDEISFGDNDFLAAQLAILLGAELLVLLTLAPGVYSADPALDPSARLVPRVADVEELRGLAIGAGTSPLGSGGMRSKVVAAEMASAAGIETVIAGGLEPGVITAAVAGEAVGTRIAAQAGRASSFKLWLRYAKPTRGRVIIDAGAARALRDGSNSLLAVGVAGVEGEFDAGDAVEVLCDGVILGKGISSMSAPELASVAGMQSAQVRAALPQAPDEAIHRDHLVLV